MAPVSPVEPRRVAGRTRAARGTIRAMAGPDGEPDYRFTLANERTFLAWIRTSLALLAAAVALGRLVPDLGPEGLRKALAITLACLAVVTAGGSVCRWRSVQLWGDRNEPIPRSTLAYVLAAVLLIVGVVVAVLLLASRATS